MLLVDLGSEQITDDALGILASKQSDAQAALAHHQEARALREDLVEEYPDNKQYAAELGRTLHHVGVLLTQQGDGRKALTTFQRAIGVFEKAPLKITWGRSHSSALQNIAAEQAAVGVFQGDRDLQPVGGVAGLDQAAAHATGRAGNSDSCHVAGISFFLVL